MKPVFPVIIYLLFASILNFAQEATIFDAVKSNDIESVKIFLENNSDLVLAKDDYGRTPLHWAARGVYPELMNELIRSGADVNARDINDVTPIISVVARNHSDALRLLIDNGAKTLDQDIEGDYLIHLAASYGYPDMISILMEKDEVLELRNSRERTPLILACRESGDLETVKFLIKRGADVNAIDRYGGTPLSLSAWRGYEGIVNLLLDEGATVDVHGKAGMKLLQYACGKNLTQLYQSIADKGGDIISSQHEGQSALHWASMGGSIDIVEDLLSRGLDAGDPDLYGWSPIHYAAYFGREEVVACLIENGADLELMTPLRETAYILAILRDNEKVADLLVENGAKVTNIGKTNIVGKYFGQHRPGNTSELFAPGIASRLKGGHSNITFPRDANMAFWTEWNLTETGYSDGSMLLYSHIQNGEWTYPEILHQKADCPVFSPDGTSIYFLASLTDNDGNEKYGIWFYNLDGGSLSDPSYLDFDVQKYGLYWQFSFDKAGNLYFGGAHGLSIARNAGGKFEAPQLLSDCMHPEYTGGSPFISPGGDFLIFNSADIEECYGGSDLYAGFKMRDGTWSSPINLGTDINTSESESLARLSSDGKYLFYKTNFGSIRWISSEVIERLRPE